MPNLNTETARKIYEAHKKKELFSAIVFGKRGYGKSSFCLKVIYDLYHNGYGYDIKDAWLKAIQKTVNSKEQLSDVANDLREEDKRAKVLHLDDIGQWMSGDIWQKKGNAEERELLFEIRRLVPVMRTRSAGNLFSCDNPLELDSSIRNRPHHIIKIVKGGNDDHRRPRTARIYPQDVYPSLQKRISADTLWTHKFDAMLPDWVYDIYERIRKKYADRTIKRAKDKRENAKEDKGPEFDKKGVIDYLDKGKDHWELSPGQGQKSIKIPKSHGNFAELLRLSKNEVYRKRS